MTAVTLPNVGVQAGFINEESGWGAAMNANLRALDALTQARVVDKDLTAPPATPTSGALYIVGAAATGAWAGNVGKLALWQVGDDLAGVWRLITPKSGFLVFVADESMYYRFDGATWVSGLVTIPEVKQVFTIQLQEDVLAVGQDLANFHVPFPFKLKAVQVGLRTAQTTGPLVTFNVKKNGSTLFVIKPTVDNNERTSLTATTACTYQAPDALFAAGDEVTVDLDQVGDGTARGAKIYLVGVAI